MKNILRQALVEYKEKHENDTSVDIEKINTLIERNENDYLTNPYMGLAEWELEGFMEYLDNGSITNQRILEVINAHKPEVIEKIYGLTHQDDDIWDVYTKDIEFILNKFLEKEGFIPITFELKE